MLRTPQHQETGCAQGFSSSHTGRICIVGKKTKKRIRHVWEEHEAAIEAAYFARNFGLTKEEALKILKDDARILTPCPCRKSPKGPLVERNMRAASSHPPG